ncbi:MAG: hypothetical protein KDA65_03835 [Planctomycetaceae bacterium]|nr:hypothetical protein [Planctomycetaceae bacterium]
MKKYLTRRVLWSLLIVVVFFAALFGYQKHQETARANFLHHNTDVSLSWETNAPHILRNLLPHKTLRWLGFEEITSIRVPSDEKLLELNRLFDLSQVLSAELTGSKISDDYLFILQEMPKLRELNLDGSQVTDASVPIFAELTRLRSLSIINTQITSDGLLKIKAGHSPQFIIVGATIPPMDQWKLLMQLPHLKVIGPGRGLPLYKEIKDEDLLLANQPVFWRGNSFVKFHLTDKGMGQLPHFVKIETLTIQAQEKGVITDAGIQSLGKLSQLKWLTLDGADLSNAGMQTFSSLPNLQSLQLNSPVDPDKITVQGWQQVAANRNIQHLSVSGMNFDAASIDTLAVLPGLKSLSLSDCRLTPDALAGLAKYYSLETIHLEQMTVTEEQLRTIASLPKLMRLSLQNCEFDTSILAELEGHPLLNSLSLKGIVVPDELFESLVTIPLLERVSLEECQISQNGYAALSRLPQCHYLGLNGSNITDEELAFFAEQSLWQLELGQTAITDAGMKHVASMKALSQLSVAGTTITDEGIKHLSKSEPLRTMSVSADSYPAALQVKPATITVSRWQRLDFSETRITDESLFILKKMLGTSSLNLNLSNTQITNEGLKHLQGIPRLQSLDLRGTRITNEAIPTLKNITVNQLNIEETGITDSAELKNSARIEVEY